MNSRLIKILCASLSCVLLLTACTTSKQTKFPDEGVNTLVTVTGYHDVSKHHDMYLQQGDQIAVISPSSLPTRKQTDEVMEGLKKWGYVPVEGKYTCVKERTLQNCIDDVKWALEDDDIKAIYCVRGGYAASEVMDKITLKMIKAAHKLILGYSDITVYNSAWICSGLPAIQTSMSAAFEEDFNQACLEVQKNMMIGKIPEYKCTSDTYCHEGKGTGILIGGNLATLTSCLNTDYDVTKIDEPYILFIEDVEEDFQHIHRYLTQLKHAGVFKRATGVIFGEFVDIPDETGDYDGDSRGGTFTSVEDMIYSEFTQEFNIPVAFGFPSGHGDVNYPLLMGETVELKVSEDNYTLEWH